MHCVIVPQIGNARCFGTTPCYDIIVTGRVDLGNLGSVDAVVTAVDGQRCTVAHNRDLIVVPIYNNGSTFCRDRATLVVTINRNRRAAGHGLSKPRTPFWTVTFCLASVGAAQQAQSTPKVDTRQ